MIVWLFCSYCVITLISFLFYIFDRSGNFSFELSFKLMEFASCVFLLLYFLNLLFGWGWSLI